VGLNLTVIVCSTFLSILYGELAMWLGIGRKWMLASCVALGANAMFFNNFGTGESSGTVMLLVQFAIPLAVGWWFAKRRYNHGYVATTFLVFLLFFWSSPYRRWHRLGFFRSLPF
jgi:hypothetical protein